MLGKTHEIGGITALLGADVIYQGVQVNPATAIFCLFIALIGALTPDLDKPTSLIYQKIPAGTLIGRIVHPIFIGGHRHISHSILGFFLFAWASHYLLFTYVHINGLHIQLIWISYLIGIISHLILDAMTTEGIPLLFPIPIKFGIPPIKQLRIVTGSWVEHLIVFPLLIIGIVYMYIHFTYLFNR